MSTFIRFLDALDVDRILRLLYHGTRPRGVRYLICSCGRGANLTESDAQAIGWQLLPHVQCPDCVAQVPYTGAEARERFVALVEDLVRKEG